MNMNTMSEDRIKEITEQQARLKSAGMLIPADNSNLVYLVGQGYPTSSGEDRTTLWQSLTPETSFLFKLEPDNPYDPNAVLVFRDGDPDTDIGYLAKKTNAHVVQWLQEGRRVTGKTKFLNRCDGGRVNVGITPYVRDPYVHNENPFPDFDRVFDKEAQYKGTCRGDLAANGAQFVSWMGVQEGNEVSLTWQPHGMVYDLATVVNINGEPVGFLRGNNRDRLSAWCFQGHAFEGTVESVRMNNEPGHPMPFEINFSARYCGPQ
jgi:hypothetical protein